MVELIARHNEIEQQLAGLNGNVKTIINPFTNRTVACGCSGACAGKEQL